MLGPKTRAVDPVIHLIYNALCYVNTLAKFPIGALHLTTITSLHLGALHKTIIVAKRRAPMAKSAMLWPISTSWIPWTRNVWILRFGRGWHWSTFKKLAVKSTSFGFLTASDHAIFWRSICPYVDAHSFFKVLCL